MDSVLLSEVIPIASGILSGPILWGGLTHILTRRREKERVEREQREHERLIEKDETDREERANERRMLLAQAQATAQETALRSADERYQMLHEDYDTIRKTTIALRDSMWQLIDVLEGFVRKLRPVTNGSAIEGAQAYVAEVTTDEYGDARRAINEARSRLR